MSKICPNLHMKRNTIKETSNLKKQTSQASKWFQAWGTELVRVTNCTYGFRIGNVWGVSCQSKWQIKTYRCVFRTQANM